MKQIIKASFLLLAFVGVLATLLASPRPASAAATSYQFPCSPYPSNYYGFGDYVSGWGYHTGEDVCGAAGTPVYSIAEGTVVYSAKTPDSYRWGNLIMIQYTNADGSQITGVYGHLSADRRVAAGQGVAKGQLIGFVGPSYTADNGNWVAHLHLTLRHGAYGAGIGTYAPGIVGYVGTADGLGAFARPSDYISKRTVAPPTYGYETVSVTGGGAYNKTAQYTVEFKVRNTGSTTWAASGANAVRLGTSSPRDRGSGFSAGMGGFGWIYPHRAVLSADTAPGGIGTFTLKFNNTGINPGTYTERFALVIDGQLWLPGPELAVTVGVRPYQTAAQYAGQNSFSTLSPTDTSSPQSPYYLTPGQKINVKAYIRNAGDDNWSASGPNPIRLGTTHPNDRGSAFMTMGQGSIPASENWLSGNRASGLDGRLEANGTVVADDTIGPGEIAVFSFTATAPSAPGSYAEYFNPILEGRQWLNDLGMYFPFRVVAPGYHYEYAGQDNPAAFAFAKGQSTAAVYLRNSGQTAWPINGTVRLATDRSLDRLSNFKSNDWLSANRVSTIDSNQTTPGKSTVAAGEVAKFTFTTSTQSTPDGSYNEYFRPVVEGVQWMPEDYGIYVPVKVDSPALDYTFVDQRFSEDPGSLHYGDKLTATLIVRNIGKTTWSNAAANPVRLGTARPNDRGSGFSVLTGADAWISSARASVVDALLSGVTVAGNSFSTQGSTSTPATQLKQGEIGVFTVPLTVPAVPVGAYNEYFNLVQDGVNWFPDYGIYFPFYVVGP